jgi:hypothetical protein
MVQNSESSFDGLSIACQVRNAMALATILNRTLILPEFWCGSQHYYGPHDGHVPYSRGPLPYKCPPDLILDLLGKGLEAA